MILKPSDRDFDAQRATWINVACAFIFTAALVVIPILMPNTHGAFTAKISNPTNSVTVASFPTCKQTMLAETDKDFVLQLNSTSPTNLADSRYKATADPSIQKMDGENGCWNDEPGFLRFPGGGDKIAVTYQAPIAQSVTFTQEVWFRTSTPGGGLMFAENTTSTVYNRQLYLNSAGQVAMGSTKFLDYEGAQSKDSFADGKWHHVVAVRSVADSRIYLYVDGALVGDSSLKPDMDYLKPANWRIGCFRPNIFFPSSAPNCLKGDISFAAVYNRAFTQADVTRHYKAGTG